MACISFLVMGVVVWFAWRVFSTLPTEETKTGSSGSPVQKKHQATKPRSVTQSGATKRSTRPQPSRSSSTSPSQGVQQTPPRSPTRKQQPTSEMGSADALRQEIKAIKADGERRRVEAETQYRQASNRLDANQRNHAILSDRTEVCRQSLIAAASRLEGRRARNLLHPEDPKNDAGPPSEAVKDHTRLQREYIELSDRLDKSNQVLVRLEHEARQARKRVQSIVATTARKVRDLEKKLDALNAKERVRRENKQSARPSSNPRRESTSRPKPASTSVAPWTDKGPPPTPSSIEEAARLRGIKELVHFTRIENLRTIAANGILSVAEAQRHGLKPLCNDEKRLDQLPNHISLSVSWTNWQLFYKFRQERDLSEHYWCVLVVDPSIIWTLPCLFAAGNAASSKESRRPLEERKTVQAFERMFADAGGNRAELKRQSLQIPDHFPTNPQAEVLVEQRVPFERVMRIVVFNEEGKCQATKILPTSRHPLLEINRQMFERRSDWQHWSGARSKQQSASQDPRRADADKLYDDDIPF